VFTLCWQPTSSTDFAPDATSALQQSPAEDPSKLTVTLTPQEYYSIRPNMRSDRPQLQGDWKQLLYDKFYGLWPTCPVVFTYSHVRKLDSRKKSGSFWHGIAECPDCVTAHFYIHSEPAQNEHVVVDVNVIGRCTHSASTEDDTPVTRRRGRRLHGARRQETARVLVTRATTPTKEYYEQLSHMPSAAVAAGNITECRSPAVYRQAAYEYRRKQQLHPDMILELRMQTQD